MTRVECEGDDSIVPLPAGPFGCILADPPWRFTTWSEKGRDRCPDGLSKAATERWWRNHLRNNDPERHYKTMPLEDIKALPVGAAAAKHSVLLMWIVDSMMPEALQVGEAWGFKYKTTAFVWVKGREHFSAVPGLGYWSRKQAELCLLFTRGAPKRLTNGVEQVIYCKRGAHSAKPEEQYRRIEALVGGPYLELFSRASQPGWTAWGNPTGIRDGLFDAATVPAPPEQADIFAMGEG